MKKDFPDFVGILFWAFQLVIVIVPLVPLRNQSILSWASDTLYRGLATIAGKNDFVEGVAYFGVGLTFLFGSGFLAAGVTRAIRHLFKPN